VPKILRGQELGVKIIGDSDGQKLGLTKKLLTNSLTIFSKVDH